MRNNAVTKITFTAVLLSGLVLFAAESRNAEGQETTSISRPSPEYPFESKFVEVDGHTIHYVEEGRGKPILFIHGNPVWSYVWRNVFPGVARGTNRRAIAMDLLGFGKSDKPNIDYTLDLHEKIVEGFIKKLDLEDVILVGQDWGGPLMTHYAIRHPENVDGMVFMETWLWHVDYSDYGPFEPTFRLARSPEGDFLFFELKTWFLETFLTGGILRQENLTDEVFARYLEPFPTAESRRALRQFPQLVSIEGEPKESAEFFDEIQSGLSALSFPLLWITADPGFLTSQLNAPKFDAVRQRLPHMVVRDFGPGILFVQEDDPERFVRLTVEWMLENGLDGNDEDDEEREDE